MTKQEEIRNGLIDILDGTETPYTDEDNRPRGCVDKILEYLRSKGAMLKVECPDCNWSQFSGDDVVAMTPCYRCNSTGYIEEPLIKEG